MFKRYHFTAINLALAQARAILPSGLNLRSPLHFTLESIVGSALSIPDALYPPSYLVSKCVTHIQTHIALP